MEAVEASIHRFGPDGLMLIESLAEDVRAETSQTASGRDKSSGMARRATMN
jgi:hypothetical protein